MTFDEIAKRNTTIRTLFRLAKSVKDDPSEPYFCAHSYWYSIFKPILIKQVGWMAQDETLRSEKDYDTAYLTICNALPDCRNCGCL